MARKLNAKQKKILDSATALSWEELSLNMQEALEAINMYENLWSDAERYLHDKHFDRLYSK